MYIDLFFILNACLNFLVLSMVNLIAKRNAGFLKRLLAALVGALSACLFLILPTDSGFIRLGFGFCTAFFMTSIAFVPLKKGERLKLTLGLYAVSYTHLDVYKRQHHTHFTEAEIWAAGAG